ncbi:hypothetical protein F4U02_09910 [Acinetobacter haemolyticus]|uniref:CDI immunity protein domain-containing protein n=4 Tax=Acinetobacter TaxID=469 RepID=A0AAX1MJ31_ACIJU|nr:MULTISPECIES: hypothetical protein [Acinetobacter]ENV63673.1 hypothetical protein F949_01048 [Acinetobacter junii NIPH 182]ENW18217.1 hypothetical protein F927_01655 [Acinetobacter haemolyticus CIP 64.3 = MTCC 9819]EPR89052.1 hypothetical protein L313_1768 [Acinetobacter haemolyticus CIP 64.3 = MTCC 9819]MQZ31302.1 hypothetical protein [Acinetobacter haemolyticus]NAR18693.1 hypothetical protein [Acinetobacter haemolyticus]
MWLENVQNYYFVNGYHDLYHILKETISTNKMNYLNILFHISNGYGITSSEGCGFGLEQDYDHPEEFINIQFFMGDMQSSTMELCNFFETLVKTSECYLDTYPTDKKKIHEYIDKIRQKYT